MELMTRIEFLKELGRALDDLPTPELAEWVMFDGTNFCALGALYQYRTRDNPGARKWLDRDQLSEIVALCGSDLALEVMEINDRAWFDCDRERAYEVMGSVHNVGKAMCRLRYRRVRDWVEQQTNYQDGAGGVPEKGAGDESGAT